MHLLRPFWIQMFIRTQCPCWLAQPFLTSLFLDGDEVESMDQYPQVGKLKSLPSALSRRSIKAFCSLEDKEAQKHNPFLIFSATSIGEGPLGYRTIKFPVVSRAVIYRRKSCTRLKRRGWAATALDVERAAGFINTETRLEWSTGLCLRANPWVSLFQRKLFSPVRDCKNTTR